MKIRARLRARVRFLFQKILHPAGRSESLSPTAPVLFVDAPSRRAFSLVGQERKLNWALQLSDRDEFVRQMTANLPDRPAIFSYDVGLHLQGARPHSLPSIKELSENELDAAAKNGATIIEPGSRSVRPGIFPAASISA